MKRLFLALATLFCVSSASSAATVAVATGNVNLRAGPSTAYPVVTTVPAGVQVTTHGCLSGYTWCDISMGVSRGWVAANYIQVVYRGAPVVLTPAVAPAVGLTVVTFNKVYWDTYYAAYPWYGRWGYYAPPPVYPVAPGTRVTSYDRSVQCANGSCTATRSATGTYGGSASQSRTCSGGTCTSTRSATGPYGASASRTRSCSGNTQSCTVTRTGPAGNSGIRTFTR